MRQKPINQPVVRNQPAQPSMINSGRFYPVKSVLSALLLLPFLAACVALPPPRYASYLDHMPKSILVLPPLNESMEVDAANAFLPTVTQPLSEQGYYVFPVAVIDDLMKQNGLPGPEEMHQVSLNKINEIIAPDAVLYLTIEKWGTSYQLINSVSRVTVSGRLVDAKTGTVLWSGTRSAARDSNQSNQGGLAGMLVGAIVNQVAASVADPSMDLAEEVNNSLFRNPQMGLLLGHRNPHYEEDQKKRREERQRQEAAKASQNQ